MIQPPYLKANDRVIIIAPAGKIVKSSMDNAVELLQQWGLRVQLGSHVTASYMGFAGTDEQRRMDLQTAIDDPEIAAIFCARGGYGCGRIIDAVDVSPLLRHPKWLVGYSDITVIHAHLQRRNIQSIHGTMPKNFPERNAGSESIDSLRRALFGELHNYEFAPHPFNRRGTAQGILMGGNLSLLTNLAATPDDMEATGSVLFIEDTEESLYRIDRMMSNLQRSGKLEEIAGLLIGGFSATEEDAFIFEETAYDIIAAYAGSLNIPVCYGFPAGHQEPNNALYLGKSVSLEVGEYSTVLRFL